jgi:hypothetical integral membrane protein (TIGR02206 family)
LATDFVLFGPLHLAILAVIPTGAWLAARATPSAAAARRARLWMGVGLAVNELIWYGFRYSQEGLRAPEGLPLQLCDLTLWLTVAAALTLNRWAYEMAYFGGMGGAAMALLTPDLWAPTFSYPTLYFFLAHGGIVGIVLYLTLRGLRRPEPGCLWRVLVVLNIYAAAMGAFNWVFGTNYMYLCQKPAGASLLDWFGPWPVYIAAGEAFAMALFALMWLPFRRGRRGMASPVTAAPLRPAG